MAGAASGFVAVALGAFGAHGLRARVTPDLLAVWKTAVEYQFYHALALLLLGVLARQSPPLPVAGPGWCFVAGTLLFSGSLYGLTLSGVRALGAITPIGGVLLLAGWVWLAYGVWRSA